MPISVAEQPLDPQLGSHFSKVLRDNGDYQQQLDSALQQQQGRLFAAHFNGQPVAVALLSKQGAQLDWLVVHPATRGRGVGKDFLRLIVAQLGVEPQLPAHCRS